MPGEVLVGNEEIFLSESVDGCRDGVVGSPSLGERLAMVLGDGVWWWQRC